MAVLLTGYGFGTPDGLLKLAKNRKVERVVDVRLRPYSKRPEWCIGELRKVFGMRYVHLPEWGNRNRFNGGEIEIADFECGYQKYKDLPHPCLLFCSCLKPDNCHRTELGAMLEMYREIVKEVKFPQPERPEGEWWDYATTSIKRDTLRQMEVDGHADLESWRFYYTKIEDLLTAELHRIGEFTVQELPAWCHQHWIDEEEAIAVFRRMERRDVVGRDSGGSWNWWYLKEAKGAKDSRRDGAGDGNSGGKRGTGDGRSFQWDDADDGDSLNGLDQ